MRSECLPTKATPHTGPRRQSCFRVTVGSVGRGGAAVPENKASSSEQWSGASKIEIGGGIITPENHKGSDAWRRQAQLGQIVEMIHVASLIHDDVLDEADTRRGG